MKKPQAMRSYRARRRKPGESSVHRPPQLVFRDAIERALGHSSEDELRTLIKCYTGVRLALGQCNRLSQEIARLVFSNLTKGPARRRTRSRRKDT